MQALVYLFAPTSGEWNGAGLRAVRSLLLLHATVRTIAWLLTASEQTSLGVGTQVGIGVLMLLAAVGGAFRRFGRPAALLGASLVLVQVMVSFPSTKDEVYLELYCLALCGFLDADDADDGRLLRSALCWMGTLVLFHSGLQKLSYGYYFRGETLLTGITVRDPLASSLQWLLAPDERQQLMRSYRGMQGAGPFRTGSTSFAVVANAFWTLPLALAALMVPQRTRALAAAVSIAFILLISYPAHEFTEGLLLAQLFLLCVPGEWNRRLVWLFVLIYGAIALGRISVIAPILWARGGV